VQRLSDAPRIIQFGDALLKELQGLAVLRVELAEFPVRRL